MRDLDPPSAREVPVEVELLLELEDLVSGVRRSLPLWLHAGLESAIAWKTQRKKARYYTILSS